MVKAHGYGHGGPAVARAALAGGAGRLAVALVDEGVELREHGVTAPVLLLSECDPAAAATALVLRAHAHAVLAPRASPPGAQPPRRGGPPGRRARQGRHRHAPGRRGARGPARHCGGRGGGALLGARGHLDPSAGGRRRGGGPRLHRGPARPLRPPGGRAGRGRHHGAAAARRQHGRRHRLPPGAPRHGALRARPLRLPARAVGPGGLRRAGRAASSCARPWR